MEPAVLPPAPARLGTCRGGLLWLSILALIVVLGRLSRASGWLMAPYLAWVSFAAFLNLTVVRLNVPFGG